MKNEILSNSRSVYVLTRDNAMMTYDIIFLKNSITQVEPTAARTVSKVSTQFFSYNQCLKVSVNSAKI